MNIKHFLTSLVERAMTLSLIHISEPTRRYAISYAVFCLKNMGHCHPKHYARLEHQRESAASCSAITMVGSSASAEALMAIYPPLVKMPRADSPRLGKLRFCLQTINESDCCYRIKTIFGALSKTSC